MQHLALPTETSEAVDLQVAASIASQLSQAWATLSAEKRHFTVSRGVGGSPPFAEFSFAIPMRLEHDGSTFAIVILIGRQDATTVASTMFGVEAEALSDDDLRDASSEVCNIFADCIATRQYGAAIIGVGLPFRLSQANYHYVFDASGQRDIFESTGPSETLRVLRFTPSDAMP